MRPSPGVTSSSKRKTPVACGPISYNSLPATAYFSHNDGPKPPKKGRPSGKPRYTGTSVFVTPAAQSERLQEYVRRGIVGRDSLPQGMQGDNGRKRFSVHVDVQRGGAASSNLSESSKRARVFHELNGEGGNGVGLGPVACQTKHKEDSRNTCNQELHFPPRPTRKPHMSA